MLPTSAPPPPPPLPFNARCQEATPSLSNQLVVLEDPTGQARARSTRYTSNGAV
ncbi:unnamed protein product [Ectocarpus sp. 13 AM-2016]